MFNWLVGLAAHVVATRGTAAVKALFVCTPRRAAVAPVPVRPTSSTNKRKVKVPLRAKLSKIVLIIVLFCALRRATASLPLKLNVLPEILTGPFVDGLFISALKLAEPFLAATDMF